MKIYAVQMRVYSGNPEKNFEYMKGAIERAKKAKAQLILFPKESLIGSSKLGDFGLEKSFIKKCDEKFSLLREMSKDIDILIGGTPTFENVSTDIYGSRFFSEGKNAIWKRSFEVLSGYSAYSIHKREIAINRCRETALKLKKTVVYLGAVGTENLGKNIYAMDGGSFIVNKEGDVIKEPKNFRPLEVIVNIEEDNTIKIIPQDDTEISDYSPKLISKIAEIHDALVFMIRENLKKFGIKRIVIGASGGIDSAVSAVLYSEAIGSENVFLVNMPTQFNSQTTKDAAFDLANNLGCPYMVAPISDIVDTVTSLLSKCSFVRNDSKIEVNGINHENLQARTRSASVLSTIASVLGAGITCNGNKSEATVGYCTLYGDTCGVMCALGDLWKTQVYELANYINREKEIIPQASIDIPASAELSDAMNVDEGKGDPIKYPYHDKLFAQWVEFGCSLAETEEMLSKGAENFCSLLRVNLDYFKSLFANTEEALADMRAWHKRFRGIALAKRIQFPPILSISGRAFGGEYQEAQI